MSQTTYRTTPVDTDKMPPGIGYIVGNEAAERFSYYGMKGILVVFMTTHLMDSTGQLAPMSKPDANAVYHTFSAANYFFPIFGALLADLFWGKYRTIIWLSLVYCLGHLALAIDETRTGLYIGLTLIAVGSGGIKPCVSSHVGDQFSKSNKHLLERVYGWFYFSINFGSMFATMLTPLLLTVPQYGTHLAFGLPGILMGLATLTFWLGRNQYVHIPPREAGFLREAVSPEGRLILGRLALIFAFIAVFWSLYDQTGSAWVLQANEMDRRLFGYELEASQIQTINPILVMIFIPLFTLGIYPLASRYIRIAPLGKVSVGLFFAVASFATSALIEIWLGQGIKVHISWQLLAFVLMTIAEVMVYFTTLEFSYTQAPPSMKSFVMAMNMLAVTAGNAFTALVNSSISESPWFANFMQGSNYYWFFAGIMLLASFLFIPIALTYRGQTYLQDSAELASEPAQDE